MNIIDSFSGEYAFLSNFYCKPFTYSDRVWPTAEHAYQAAKTHVAREYENIAIASSPSKAKAYGRCCTLRPDWDDVKDKIMKSILRKKFSVPVLRDMLISTGDAMLVEGNNWGDTYWGICRGKGKNRLGIILMEVREEIGGEKTKERRKLL